MVVAEVYPAGGMEILERMRRGVRLGHDTFLSGRLSQKTMSAAIQILRDYKQVLETYGVKMVRAVATSAVREATNADAFLDRISMAVDMDVDVIEPTEESRLTVTAVRDAVGDALGFNEGTVLIAEVGGGSALMSILNDGEIAASESYNVGSVRLQEIFASSQERPERASDLFRHHIDNVITVATRSLPLCEVKSFFAVGGDIRFAANQVGVKGPSPDLHIVSRGEFDRLVETCSVHSAEELSRTYGLPFPDAETLVPALLTYQAILHATQSQQIIVSDVSMRDGLLLDIAHLIRGEEDRELAESVLHTAKSIGEKYRYDERHANHVAWLAVRLFDELSREHRLGSRERLLLETAGLLHEIGLFVSNRAHHKHSYYLIINSEIFGLRREELAVVAHVARYHRRSIPKSTHTDYMTLPREKRVLVNKLAAILRVADALDRGHSQQVADFSIEKRPGEIVICINGVADLTLERHAMSQKANLFEDAFGLNVRLEETSLDHHGGRRATPVE
jgi:exopolyphosphatase/guanosine-5'-triphosphate,3'-diphosphate pyrophosphatase